MSIHGFIDSFSTSLGARFMPKYFRDGAESGTVAEVLREIELELPAIEGEGEYELTAGTAVGELEAGFRLVQWIGDSVPAIVYHHGAAETPYDYGFKGIFPVHKMEIPANLLLVRAPFHRNMKDFQSGIRTLANITAMLAVSVLVIEHLAQHCRQNGVDRIVVAGTSLGGFITNLHHIHFNSADVYTPLLAGLAMEDAYLVSAYSKAVDPRAREESADSIKSVLNFENGFAAGENGNVFPLLARHDRLIRYERQKESYGGHPVSTIEKGHATGALSYKQLRTHILDHL